MTKTMVSRGLVLGLLSVLLLLLWACAGPEPGPPASESTVAALPRPRLPSQTGLSSNQAIGDAAVQRRAAIAVGEWVRLKTAGARFVPLHEEPQPSFYHGLPTGTLAQIAAFNSVRTWFKIRLKDGKVGWVQAVNIAWITPVPESEIPVASDVEAADLETGFDSGVESDVGAEATLVLGPMVGGTTAASARIWIRANAPARWSVMVGERDDLSDGRIVSGLALNAHAGFAGTVEVAGLRPATRYYYDVLINDVPATAAPHPSFVTAPPEGTASRLRFAFISCVGKPRNAALAWRDLAQVPFDLLLQLGDNHYADSTNPSKLRSAYASHRKLAGFRNVTRRTPTLGIWDDHDFANNNSDRTAKAKSRSLAVFMQFWPNPAFGQETDPGIYFKYSYGDVDFFMLDGRYHRWPNESRDNGHKSMLGPAQLAWLKRELAASRARIKFLVSGGEWQSFGSSDSWKSFKRERDEILGFIEDNGISGVMLLSGDRHITAGYHVLGRFIEITSGPFGSGSLKTLESRERIFLHKKGNYFSVFDLDTREGEPKVTLEVYEVGKGLIEKRSFSWAEINGEVPVAALARPVPRSSSAAAAEGGYSSIAFHIAPRPR